MAPTLRREGGYRFFFFSREEPRPHVHVNHSDGEAKFWLEPAVALAQNVGLDARQLRECAALVERYRDEFLAAWHRHFG